MKQIRFWALITSVALLFVGCCRPCRAYQKLRQPLVGTQWQLVQLQGEKVMPEEGLFTLRFSEEGEVTGMGACNHLMGSYETEADRSLRVAPLATTRMLCRDTREGLFLNTLDQVTHYDMDGPMLMLLSNGRLVALMEAQVQN